MSNVTSVSVCSICLPAATHRNCAFHSEIRLNLSRDIACQLETVMSFSSGSSNFLLLSTMYLFLNESQVALSSEMSVSFSCVRFPRRHHNYKKKARRITINLSRSAFPFSFLCTCNRPGDLLRFQG